MDLEELITSITSRDEGLMDTDIADNNRDTQTKPKRFQ